MTKIKELRKAKGLTQAELAEIMNVIQTTVSMWENGKSNPRIDALPTLAKVLGCKIDDLFEKDVE